ncbi:MAG: RDD family protein [Flavobacteriaceae bacterium]
MDNFQIETAQNVTISQNIAGIGDRILAYIIDSVLIGVYFLIVFYIFGITGVDFDSTFLFIMTIGLPVFIYHLLWETFWNGQSPGKAAMKIRVVKVDGSKPAFPNYLLRWLLRLVDISFTSGALAVVVILVNGKGQRLGDLAAATTVITEKKVSAISDTLLVDLPEGYVPKYPQVTVFNDTEIQTIKSIYHQPPRAGNDNNI